MIDDSRYDRALTGASSAEAKEAVHLSATWAGIRERDDEFHRSLEQGHSRDR